MQPRSLGQCREMTNGKANRTGAAATADQLMSANEEVEAIGLARQAMPRPEFVRIGMVDLQITDRSTVSGGLTPRS